MKALLALAVLAAGCGGEEQNHNVHRGQLPDFTTAQGVWVYDDDSGLNSDKIDIIIEATIAAAAVIDPYFDEQKIRAMMACGWPEMTITKMVKIECGGEDAFGCYVAWRITAGVLHGYDVSSTMIPHELCHFFSDVIHGDMGHNDMYFGAFGVSDKATFDLMSL